MTTFLNVVTMWILHLDLQSEWKTNHVSTQTRISQHSVLLLHCRPSGIIKFCFNDTLHTFKILGDKLLLVVVRSFRTEIRSLKVKIQQMICILIKLLDQKLYSTNSSAVLISILISAIKWMSYCYVFFIVYVTKL